MQYQALAAPAALQHVIQGFWYTCIDFAQFPAGFEIVPDGSAEIIFHFGQPCHLMAEGGELVLPSPFLMGLLSQPVWLRGAGPLEVIGVKCFPWTVFDLLGLPAGNDGARVFTHAVARLQPVLAECIRAGQIPQALTLVQQFFLNAQSETPAPDSTLLKAGGALQQARGTLPVREVAAAAHATVRTLERKFKQAAGHTVKDVSGLLRFEQVRNRLWQQPAANLAALADELGYTDQSHLSREFRRYSGTTPAAFARSARQRQQDLGTDFVAFVQA